ncbi:MAG: hypothetical protein HQK52_18195 [Oligoflexia bacterium]|nr:hypothetical protein [Oligoflexia bacterium]
MHSTRFRNNDSGMSLVELMLAMGVGCLLLIMVVSFMKHSSKMAKQMSNEEDSISAVMLAIHKLKGDIKVATNLYLSSDGSLNVIFSEVDLTSSTVTFKKANWMISSGNLRRELIDPMSGATISSMNYPEIVGFQWCLDLDTTSPSMTPASCPQLPRIGFSGKRFVGEFKYLSTVQDANATSSVSGGAGPPPNTLSIGLIVNPGNVPYDCKTVSNVVVR